MTHGLTALQRRLRAVETARQQTQWQAEYVHEHAHQWQTFMELLLPTMREDHRDLLLAANAEFQRLWAEMWAARRDGRAYVEPWGIVWDMPGGRLHFEMQQQYLQFTSDGTPPAMPPEWVERFLATDPQVWNLPPRITCR